MIIRKVNGGQPHMYDTKETQQTFSHRSEKFDFIQPNIYHYKGSQYVIRISDLVHPKC